MVGFLDGVDRKGAGGLHRRAYTEAALECLAKLAGCLVVPEACGSAHCGPKLTVRYTGGRHDFLRYS
jgi:hypothetical protein